MARKLSPGVHTIRIKKPGGGTRLQRVKVLKSGKFKFIKNVKGGAKPKAKKAAAKPRGKKGRTSPGRRQPRMARKGSLANRLINAGLLALTFSTAIRILIGGGSIQTKMAALQRAYTGFGQDGSFSANRLIEGYAPVAVGFVLFEVKKMAMKKFRF